MLQFQPFRLIRAEYNRVGVRLFLEDVARSAHFAFRAGSEASRGGMVYRRRGGALHRASAPGEWPARMEGKLLASIRTQVTTNEATIGTSATSEKGAPYSIFLRTGTRKMARRKMSDDAIQRGVALARPRAQAFGRFRRG